MVEHKRRLTTEYAVKTSILCTLSIRKKDLASPQRNFIQTKPNKSLKNSFKVRLGHNSDLVCDYHTKLFLTSKLSIKNNILECIGNTPLVRLNSIPKTENLSCELLVKCEYFNAGGSVKDRIAKRMIDEAEKNGTLKPGFTIIEPTSGNTGIGLALASAIKGYRCIIVLPEKMSQEKVDVLKALGAEIIRTPTEAAWDAPESHIGVANRLVKEIPNSVILNQYDNPFNPLTHYETTAEEILEACDGNVDMVVISAGTGGTITGISKKIKEKCPQCIVVGVDPIGSILARPENLNSDIKSYQVEGIGYDFIPKSLEYGSIDYWMKSEDKPSFLMSRRLIREEGLLVGGSAGSAVYAAVQAAKVLGPGQRCVVLLPDSIRNYMTKFLNDKWMESHGFIETPASNTISSKPSKVYTIGDLNLRKAIVVYTTTTVEEASQIMVDLAFDQLPVISSTGHLKGVVTLGNIVSRMSSGHLTPKSSVSDIMFKFNTGSNKKYKEISLETSLDQLKEFFETNSAAIVTERVAINETGVAFKPVHVLTQMDLLSFSMGYNFKI
ncbi:hypothetical protein BB561_000787 [Smittium simulii]|uniref:Cystathionine beta-synthase n=1 Tax=Smittium simulii TaxID=133385 RepID=A0A2T9YXK1_9FUNG|nr:hypothetical protein BB561_000787 [Smittium simulii]